MSKRLSAPGKTFLVGEYLALAGGPSILLSTGPRFQLKASLKSEDEAPTPFADQSPAARLMSHYPRDFQDYKFKFTDPHEGAGGLGASSAQWALLYALKFGVSSRWEAVLDEYHRCAWGGAGAAPSGADVVSQMHGGITWYDGREFQARSLEWKFPSLSFTLIRTGAKLATHDHLRANPSAPTEILRQTVRETTQAFEDVNEDLLVASINRYAAVLQESGRTSENTLQLLNKINREPWAVASKGCGAMGADVVLVLHDLAGGKKAAAWAESQGLVTCGSLQDIETGLRFEV